MDSLYLFKREYSLTLFQLICWPLSLACISILLLNNTRFRAQWLAIPFPFAKAFASLFTIQSKIEEKHETAECLRYMVEIDGAGSWPPRATFGDSWPAALRPYHTIYLEASKYLSCIEVSLDEEENIGKIHGFRARMQKLLQEQVDFPAVKAIFEALESGNDQALPLEDLNGFFSCIAMSKHAFRWGTVPIVKYAQEETVVIFPEQLDLPWNYFCRRFGILSPGGNITANNLCNSDGEKQVYYINPQMSKEIINTETNFMHMFCPIERESLPMYQNMVASIIHYETGNREACLDALRKVVEQLRIPLRISQETFDETMISSKIWMPYVQGFQGWAAGQIENGEYVEYDGLSGNQLPMSFFVDAFLGIGQYLPQENMLRYIPVSQRRLKDSFFKHSFREKAKREGDAEIEKQMQKILKQLRAFRLGHRSRVVPYLSVPAPERFIMTAGKSVLENDIIKDVKGAMEFLDGFLEKRLKETV